MDPAPLRSRGEMLAEAWDALGGAPAAPDVLRIVEPAAFLGSRLDVDALAVASVGCALVAAAELQAARGGKAPSVRVDARETALAFASERHLRTEAEVGPAFAALSRFVSTFDGWIRTHANYPWHREALLEVLGRPADATEALARAGSRRAVDLEVEVVAAGGAAAALRDAATWAEHPQGRALAGRPLLDLVPAAAGAGRALPGGTPAAGRPLEGLKVLDLTRVIAGPVATRFLAALGADVLRIAAPERPELPLALLDGGVGKRCAALDLRSPAGRETCGRLAAEADVVVLGYRPGALERLGLDPAPLRAAHPHLVTVRLTAWGETGPWGGRRGFDSLVQAATGIAAAERDPDGRPGALPVQALDHGTGYLAAAAAIRGLALRAATGRGAHGELALARTAGWLLRHPAAPGGPGEAPAPRAEDRVRLEGSAGAVEVVRPPGAVEGVRPAWTRGPAAEGADAPAWA